MPILPKDMRGVVKLPGGGEYQLLANKLVLTIQECVVRCKCETNLGVVKCILPAISDFRGNFGNVKIIMLDSGMNTGTNKITIEASPGDTINGATSHEINVNGASEIIEIGDGNTWVLA